MLCLLRKESSCQRNSHSPTSRKFSKNKNAPDVKIKLLFPSWWGQVAFYALRSSFLHLRCETETGKNDRCSSRCFVCFDSFQLCVHCRQSCCVRRFGTENKTPYLYWRLFCHIGRCRFFLRFFGMMGDLDDWTFALSSASSLRSLARFVSHSRTLSSAVVSSPITSCSTCNSDTCDGSWRSPLLQNKNHE